MSIDQYRRVKDPLDRALRLATDAHQGQKSFRQVQRQVRPWRASVEVLGE